MTLLTGFGEKILNFFIVPRLKKVSWSECVANIVIFLDLMKTGTEAYKENSDKSPSEGGGGKHCSKACKQTAPLKWVSEFQWILIICEDR